MVNVKQLPFYHQHDFLKMHHFYISAKHKINKKWHGKQAIEKWLLKNQYLIKSFYAMYLLKDAFTLSSLTVTYIIVVSGFLCPA